MTVVFLSRPLGRHVEQTTSAQTAYTNPKKRFYASPDAAVGQVVPTTVGEKGFSVTVSRTGDRRRRQGHPPGQLLVALHPRGRDLPRRQGRHAARRPDAGRALPRLHRLVGRHRPRALAREAGQEEAKKPADGTTAGGSIPGIPAGHRDARLDTPGRHDARRRHDHDAEPRPPERRHRLQRRPSEQRSDLRLCTPTRPGRSRPRRRRSAPSSRSARSA